MLGAQRAWGPCAVRSVCCVNCPRCRLSRKLTPATLMKAVAEANLMFKRRTVFIVGAGASQEVRFPTGPELALSIAADLKPSSEDIHVYGPRTHFHARDLYNEVVRSVGGRNEEISAYLAAAARIHGRSYAPRHRNDPQRDRIPRAQARQRALMSRRGQRRVERSQKDDGDGAPLLGRGRLSMAPSRAQRATSPELLTQS
jgi:hypothetical protein